jgi:DNA-binding SARP family transcriptional activator
VNAVAAGVKNPAKIGHLKSSLRMVDLRFIIERGSVDTSLRFFGGFQPSERLNQRHQALLAYIALRHHQPISRSELAFALWAESSEEQALTNLRKALHTIKQAFGEELILVSGRTLQINPTLDIQIDIDDFNTAIASAQQYRLANQAMDEQSAIETAVDLYRGDLLPGIYDEWLLHEREALRVQFMASLDRLISLLEARQHYRDAILYAQRFLQLDKLREETYRTLIRLHALNNDRAAALNVYHTCAGILSKELRVEPETSTRELYERLLKNETQIFKVSPPGLPISHPLVARENEWKTLLAEWKKSLQGNLRALLISGEAGIGKTRLGEDLLHWASRQGFHTASAACYSAEGQISYAPVTGWLKSASVQKLDTRWRNELGRILPDLQNDTPLPSITESWQKRVYFEAMARALLVGNEPALHHAN